MLRGSFIVLPLFLFTQHCSNERDHEAPAISPDATSLCAFLFSGKFLTLIGANTIGIFVVSLASLLYAVMLHGGITKCTFILLQRTPTVDLCEHLFFYFCRVCAWLPMPLCSFAPS